MCWSITIIWQTYRIDLIKNLIKLVHSHLMQYIFLKWLA